MNEISSELKKLINKNKSSVELLEQQGQTGTIHVDEVASRVASFYEKIRGIIDWKEKHLLKRSAIERSLKRKVFPKINLTNGKIIDVKIDAESLVFELIRSGHFPNNKIKETRIEEVQKIIDKYIFIINKAPKNKKKSQISFMQWLFSIAACEIEESLDTSIKERALMNFMYEKIKDYIVLSDRLLKSEKITENEKNMQVLINVQRALFNLDDSVIGYHLIKYKYPDWSNFSFDKIKNIANTIHEIENDIDYSFNHPLSGKISKICHKYNTPYLIIGDIINEEFVELKEKILNPSKLESIIREKYKKRLNSLKSRIKRAAFYSTISIFLTNIVALLAIEIPVSRYFYGEFSPITYAVDIFVPTIIMAILVITIKSPPKENIEKVVMETMKIVYRNEKKDIYEIKKFRKKGFIFNFLSFLIYSISFIASISFIFWCLNKINFPPFSYFVFIIFLSLIAFAGTKIREKSKELHMIDKRDGFFTMIIDIFALPIILFGRWLTIRWKKYNVITVFFNALIDMPLLIFVEFLEQWRYFLKEKKEKL